MGRGEEGRLAAAERPDKWDIRFLNLARDVAGWSKDHSTKCGTVLTRDRRVLSTGYNGFPPGMDDEDERYHERPMKYFVTEHAERNAIFNAAVHGVSTADSTAYVWGMESCSRCVRAMLLAGVRELIVGYEHDAVSRSPHMEPGNFEAADEMSRLFELVLVCEMHDLYELDVVKSWDKDAEMTRRTREVSERLVPL